MRKPIERGARADLVFKVYRGRRMAALIRTETFQDIYADMQDQQAQIDKDNIWDGVSDAAKAGMKSAFHAGRKAQVDQLLKMFDRFVRDGQEAEKKLKELGIDI